MTCIVDRCTNFGIFVTIPEFSNITGVIRACDVTNSKVMYNNISANSHNSVYCVNQKVKAALMKIDTNSYKIELSTRILESYSGEALRNVSSINDNAYQRVKSYLQRHQFKSWNTSDSINNSSTNISNINHTENLNNTYFNSSTANNANKVRIKAYNNTSSNGTRTHQSRAKKT